MKSLLLIAAVGTIALALQPLAAKPAPRISMQAARASALAIVPNGRVKSAELETENGRLVYSFDITVPNRTGIEEVQISAIDGRLISRTHESPAAERAEKRAEAREHKRR
jgi:hypothetical protein